MKKKIIDITPALDKIDTHVPGYGPMDGEDIAKDDEYFFLVLCPSYRGGGYVDLTERFHLREDENPWEFVDTPWGLMWTRNKPRWLLKAHIDPMRLRALIEEMQLLFDVICKEYHGIWDSLYGDSFYLGRNGKEAYRVIERRLKELEEEKEK